MYDFIINIKLMLSVLIVPLHTLVMSCDVKLSVMFNSFVFPISTAFYFSCCFVVGVGKTTLIRKTCDELKKRHIPVQGFYTEECRQGSHRIGFDVVTLDGNRQPLARLELAFTASVL